MPVQDDKSQLQILLDHYSPDDPRAFDELIQHAARRLRAMSHNMLARYPHLRRWEQTDDVLQMALLRLHRSLSDVRPESKQAFFGLAATQMRRTLIDLARHYFGALGHGRNYDSTAGRQGETQIEMSRVQSLDRPDDLADWTAFHEAIEHLDDEEREVISLVWYGGLKQKEIAELLEIAERTVIRRLNRAKLRLREILDQPPEPSQ